LVERFTFAQTVGPAELGEARALREPWRTELSEILGAHGVIALPTALEFAPRIGAQPVGPNWACSPVNLAGFPAVSVPVPSGGLMPASLQLIAPDHHEPRLLATAALVEAAVFPR